jgi:hypothetical protein
MTRNDLAQGTMTVESSAIDKIRDVILNVLGLHSQPSAWELVAIVEERIGWKARWDIKAAIEQMISPPTPKSAWRAYLESLAKSGDLESALKGLDAPRKEIVSSIDSLLRRSSVYQRSDQFREMITFMARFRDYAPYNNMLVRIQNPTCSFYATERDWRDRLGRNLKEDARPMLILAPMHPVMLVYALDETEGKDVPEELKAFGAYHGQWNSVWLERTVENASRRDRIYVDFKTLSSTNAGFATLARGSDKWKMRIAIHSQLDEPSRYGTLCHELAHIYLGHLGSDGDHWWPSRTDLDHRAVEIEAESTAFIVTSRLGLAGSSAAYVSRHLDGRPLPSSVSLDQVAKVASRIEQMSIGTFRPRVRRDDRDASRA